MKTIITITVRTKSKRLPKKALLKINGKTLLQYIIDAAKEFIGVPIVLCTSYFKQDDIIEQIAKENKINCYRGHPIDVLLRLFMAAHKYKADMIIGATGDNPFTSFSLGSWMLQYLIENKLDFVYTDKYPIGVAPYIVTTNAMEKVINKKKTQKTEIWGTLFLKKGFKHSNCSIFEEDCHSDWRLTVDYPKDFVVAEMIINELYKKGIPSIAELLDFLEKNKKIVDINKNLRQKRNWVKS